MTKAGKRLFIIAIASLAVIFVVLYIIAGTGGSAKQLSKVDRSEKFASKDIVLNSDDVVAESERSLPAVGLSKRLCERANVLFVSNRLRDALMLWELSAYIDENNKVSKKRLFEVKSQFERAVEEAIALGNLDFKNLRYDRAVLNWEMALNLIQDRESPIYVQTQQKIMIAKRKMQR